MNNIKSNIAETGVAETLSVLQNYLSDADVAAEAAPYIPLLEEDIASRIRFIAEGLLALEKEKLLFLTPEIAVMKALAELQAEMEVIVWLPNDWDEETCERVCGNAPRGITATFIKENQIPNDFTVSNAAVVAFGFCDGGRALIPKHNYRMLERNNSFYGTKVLVSCGDGAAGCRPIGWAAINSYEFFNHFI